MQGLRGEMDRLESALLKHIIKSTVHTSESEYRGSRVYPKSVISDKPRFAYPFNYGDISSFAGSSW